MNMKLEYNNGFILQINMEATEVINKYKIDRIEITLETNDNMCGVYFINGFYVYCVQNEIISDPSKIDNRMFHSCEEVKKVVAEETGVDMTKITVSVNTSITHDYL